MAVICPHCMDMWALSKEEIGSIYKYSEALLLNRDAICEVPKYLIDATDCHRCGNIYEPYLNIKIMNEFVFDAVKTVKM